MPVLPGDEVDLGMLEAQSGEAEYAITVAPGSEWKAYNGTTFGEPGEPVTAEGVVQNSRLSIEGVAVPPGGESGEGQYAGCFATVNFPQAAVGGIKSVTLSTAIGDSTAQLSALQMEYVEGGTNEATVQLTGTVDNRKQYEIDAAPFNTGWCTIVAGGESKTSSMAGQRVARMWTGDLMPDEIVIKGSADQAGTQDVFTLTIKVNRQS